MTAGQTEEQLSAFFNRTAPNDPSNEVNATSSYPEPKGVDKILVESYGYEWVNGKAWAPGTAPKPETPIELEPVPTPKPTPQPDPTSSPDTETALEPAPAQAENATILVPSPEPTLAPASSYPEPTGLNKILVEIYG